MPRAMPPTTTVLATLVLLVSSVGAFLSTSPSASLSPASLQTSCIIAPAVPSESESTSSTGTQLFAAYIDDNYPRDTTSNERNSNNNNDSIKKQTALPKKPPKTLPSSGGRITLVGAGPGDPNLLTVAAHKILTDPDNLIIVDRLVSQEIRDLIEGEYKVANKVPGCQGVAQDEIFEWCKEGLRAGRHVVRLKIGDPFVFGRGGEEVLEFREFGVEPAVIPGVSAAFSAPLLGSIPVTHRGISNQVVMCTGYGKDNTSPDLIQYHAEQTVVFLMAVGRLRRLCDNLVKKANYPIETPVGIVERAGCPDQRTVVGTIETIADLAEEYDVKPPSTIVVGEVVNVLLTEDDFGKEVEGARQQGLVRNVEA